MGGMRRRKTGSARAEARNGKGLGGKYVGWLTAGGSRNRQRDGICLIISGDARDWRAGKRRGKQQHSRAQLLDG